jgi:hypothetical protein
MKGIAYATIVIVALSGVLLLSLWSYNQLATGSGYSYSYQQRTKEDMANTNLELTKRFLTQDLVFSSQEASINIAANGGTQATTYWYCPDPQPPTIQEVNFALGNLSQNYMNSYVEALKDTKMGESDLTVTQYECAAITDPGKANCMGSSETCESFKTTATEGGTIEIKTPAKATYSGNIDANMNSNRFYWLYYKLYDDAMNNMLLRVISDSVRAQCTGPNTMAQKLEIAIKEACKHYEQLFAEVPQYVKCEYEIKCLSTDNPVSCLNFDCTRPAFDKEFCYNTNANSVSAAAKDNFPAIDGIGGKIVEAQGASIAGINLKIKLTDTKYNIPTSKGMKPLVWNIWAALDIGRQECRPIN